MKNIIYNNVNWQKKNFVNPQKFKDDAIIEIAESLLDSGKGSLTLKLRLNFVMDLEDEANVSEKILKEVKGLKSLEFEYIFSDLIQDEESAVRSYIPSLLAKPDFDGDILMDSASTENIQVSDGSVRIGTLGKVAAERLNQVAASFIESRIREDLGLTYRVSFENDEEEYKAAEDKLIREEKRELAEILDFNAKLAEERKKNPPKKESEKSWNGNKTWRGRGSLNAKAKGNIILGTKELKGDVISISKLSPEMEGATIEGTIFSMESITVKSGSQFFSIAITDKASSILARAFVSSEKWEEMTSLLHNGDFIRVHGAPQLDRRDFELMIMADGIEKREIERREDNYEGLHRVELHCHTKMSDMDGLNNVETIINTAAFWKQPAVAITDHGVVQSFPDAANAAEELKKEGKDIKIIYGMEGYVFDDSDAVNEDGSIDYKSKGTNHIIILAKSQEGVKNLYQLVSESHLNYFYYRPRIPKSLIQEHREGLIIGSACEAGEVFRAVVRGASDEELDRVASFYDYLEIQPLINNRFMIENETVKSEEDLKEFNRRVLACGDRLGKLTVATTDAHYDEPESAVYRRIILASRGFKDAENGQGLYLRTTQEMLDEFSYLGEERAYEVVVKNSNAISDMVDDNVRPVPMEKFPPKIEGAADTLWKSCMEKAYSIYGNPLPDRVRERLETELNSIIENEYAVLYRSAQMLVQKSLNDGYLVGSRGSVGSSFAATMAGITEVNPLEPHYLCPECKYIEWGDMELYDCGVDMPPKKCPHCGTELKREGFTIPFATFLGFNGKKEPDIDLNFAGEYQQTIHKYVGSIFGEKNIYKAGTVSTVAKKTAYGFVKKYCEETGKTINEHETTRLSLGCEGVKRTTGQHPGGIVIVPEGHDINEFCPVQYPANKDETGIITTHFDYHKIEGNLLKLDLLGHNVPSMIKHLQDMTGVDPLNIDLTDRKVLSIFNGIEALDIKEEEYPFHHGSYGIPEFGTAFVRQMLDDTHPERFADLVRISGFSHGTDVWRNNAQDYIRKGIATMREVISTRDDIMNYLILKGIDNETSFNIMEKVRKNKPLMPEDLEVMKDHGVPSWYVDSCIKIQYMFPRAHAVAYTMMSFRMAWFKVYYPREFYAAHFSSEVQDFNCDVIVKGSRACMARIEELDRFIKNAGRAVSTKKQEDEVLVLEVAYEMYARGFEFALPRLGESKATEFTVDKDGRVLIPFAALNGLGASAANALVKAYEERPFVTIEDAAQRAKLNKTAVETLRAHGVFGELPEADQISFFSMLDNL